MKKWKAIEFDKAQPSLSLYNLALDYEQNPRKLEDAPQEFRDYFSLVGLSQSLKAVYPQLPYFNEEKVEKAMNGRDFSSIDQLTNFIKNNFHTDIERYRAVYTWVAHNISFDTDALFSNKNSYSEPEDIFKYRLTRSIHKLVLAIISKSDISYPFTPLMCFGKGYGFNPNIPPESPREDDIPLLVEINGSTFISDPAWGSGYIGEDKKFHQKYNPALFLKPYIQGLHRHFPLRIKLPIHIRYSKFLQINNFEGDPYSFYLESHPYQKYYCDSGYMKFYFSCKPEVKKITAYLKYYDEKDNATDFDEDTNIKIISESPCKRFYVEVAFQKKGKYLLRVWLESEVVAKYYINNTKAIEIVPFLKPKFGKNVVPITPNVRTTKINTNYAIIKLQAAKENADVLVYIMKGSKELPINNPHSEFLVPSNDDLREIWLCVPFPNPGFYTVHIYLYNGKNYSESLIYEYDVQFQEVIEDPNIYQFINEKKDFSPILDNKLNIQPDNSSIIMKPGSFTITAFHPKNRDVLYNLMLLPSGNVIFSDSITSLNYSSTHNKVTTSFTAQNPGLYKLLAFLGSDIVWCQYYYITNKLPSDSESSPNNFLSSIANDPAVLERPFVFPDDPNEDQDEADTTKASSVQINKVQRPFPKGDAKAPDGPPIKIVEYKETPEPAQRKLVDTAPLKPDNVKPPTATVRPPVSKVRLNSGVYENSESIVITTPKDLIDKLSKIDTTKSVNKVFEEAKAYLQLEKRRGGIVAVWLEQKKQNFKDYILSKFIVDPSLPIYQEFLITRKINHASATFSSIDKACTESVEEWADNYSDIFLNIILNPKSKRRYQDGEKKFLEFFNKKYEANLMKALINNFRPIIENILFKKINDPSTRYASFIFIRRMTDCIYSNDSSGLTTNAYFHKKMSEVFSNSSRLIRNLFAFEFIKSLGLPNINITDIPSGEILPEMEGVFEYEYDNINTIIRFKPKKVGINAGFIIDIIKHDQFGEHKNILKSFYVKKYYGSTKMNSKNLDEKTSTNFFSSSPISFRASLSSVSRKSEWKKRKFDMKEPFLYSLLELLNLSPRVKFFINPYTIDGFYIATANLSDNGNSFLPISKVTIGVNDSNDTFLKSSLNQVDFLSRFLRLRDFHDDNFGFIVEHEQQIYKSLAIVDFAQSIFMESYIISADKLGKDFLDCTYSGQKNEGLRILILDDEYLDEKKKFMKTSFLKLEEKARFLNGFQALQEFQSRLRTPVPHNFGTDKTEYFLKLNVDGKYSFVKQDDILEIDEFALEQILMSKNLEIKSLMLQQRGTVDKPEEVMLKHPVTGQPRTNAELLGLKLGRKPEDADPLEEPLDYLDDAFEDLDNYCQGVMCNYKALKKFITEGYYRYFDGQGNLKVQVAE